MKPYKKILVPLDGSEVAETILPEVETIATAFKASISLLRVVDVYRIPYQDMTRFTMAAMREAEQYLQGIEGRLRPKGINVESHVRQGYDAEEILKYSEHSDIDVIAMSTHGRSGIERWLLGSVAEKIARHTTKPIFLVRATT